ncbi:diguanylate cyclase [Alkalihalophilus marmarensis]|uniref:diguanylate cyclase n=1 Tax=Alkalihalophilus marmarensis TaxID=521377 RepID=UPI002DB8A023|nr:diguanylate cyclase [Alkalihalophilus marmarensis]MEC2071180.1 diguanylate cyclase [Alkalihalophilus marmarensis]
MIQSILANISILLFMHLCIQSLYFKEKNITKLKFEKSFMQVLITSSAIIAMFYMPIFIDEFRFDLRTIPITILAIIHGPLLAIPTLIITSIWRFAVIGGPGAVPGVIFGLMIPTFIALGVFHLKKAPLTYMKGFFLYTLFWLICDLPIIFFVPNGLEAFRDFWLIRFVSFHLGAFTLFYFITLSYRNLELMDKLKHYADHDPLTGLYNVRKFSEMIREKKSAGSSYIAMLDIDHFKSINDSNGHPSGDKVLKDLASILTLYSSNHLLCARYGGEEFILCIEASSIRDAYVAADLIREKVESFPFQNIEGEKIGRVTISVGIARLEAPDQLNEAIEAADRQLYTAKTEGRNRVNIEKGHSHTASS